MDGESHTAHTAGNTFDAEATFSGAGEIGALIRSTDWSVTPLGPIASWPSSLVNYVKMLLELPSPAIIFWGPDQTQIYNQGYAAIMGPRHPRYFGAPYRECWPETYLVVYPWMEKLFEKGEVTRVEKTQFQVTRHGFTEETYFTFTFSPLRRDDGEIAGIFQPVVEVTEEVLSERRAETLRLIEPKPDSRDPMADVIAAVSGDSLDIPFSLLYIWNASANRLELAARSSSLDGFEAEFADLADMARRAFDSDAPIVIDDAGALLGGKPIGPWPEPVHCAFVHPLRRPEGGPRGALLFGVSPRLRFDGKYRRFLEVAVSQMTAAIDTMQAFQDAKKRAEALAEIDNAKTAFFNNVSHEFRTPLTLILGPAEDLLARDEAALPAGSRDQVDLIHRNSLRLLKLVNDLLDFSRFESGRMPTTFAATDLPAFTAEIVDIFRPAVERAGLELTVDCPPLPQPVHVDRDMWEKIVLNLLSNALKFTLQGRISVALRSVGSQAELTVTDTGAGIPPEELPKIFTRFHRVRSARARTQEGSGIGLAMVQELVKLHGGSVRLESTVGRGTTFIVSIPFGAALLPETVEGAESLQAHATLGSRPYLDEAMSWLPDATEPPGNPSAADPDSIDAASGAEPASEPISRPQGTDRGVVFIVDDNADMRRHLHRILAPYWETSVFRDAAGALSAALENPPDLILSDVMMPDLDGFGLLQRLRADPRTAEIPIILISARAGENATIEGIQAGAEDYLVKPFSNRELSTRVASRLEIARIRKQKDNEARDYIERLRQSEALKDELLAREQAAHADIHKFLTLIEESHDIILLLDLDGGITFLNAAGKRLRREGNSIIQAPGIFLDLCFPEDQGTARRILANALTHGSWEGEFRLRVTVPGGYPAPGGAGAAEAAMPVWWNVFVLKDHETGRPFALASVIRDLTQLKETEEHLRQTQKMEAVGKLAGGIAHDFNNLLTAINGYAELALERAADPELIEYLQEIRTSGERAATLTSQLLAYSRKQILTPKSISLNTIIADMEQMLQRFIGEDIELTKRLDPDLGMTRADPVQVEQIILNLVFNACDAMPNGGKLVLETGNAVLDENHTANLPEAKPGPYARLSVRDSGIGMTEALQARIFEPFFTTKEVDKGTGLGLSSVYGIVKQSGGGISVQSAPGSGSVFSIYLPIAAANEILPSGRITPSFSAFPKGKERILLVEDEDPVRNFVRKILEMRGFLVLESRNGIEALELAQIHKEPIQLLLTDIIMPRMSGLKLAEEFRPLHPEAKVLFMSGYTDSLQAKEELGDGDAVFLKKPFSATQLFAKIHDVLDSVNAT